MRFPLLPLVGFAGLGLLAGLAAGTFAKRPPAPSISSSESTAPRRGISEARENPFLPEIPRRTSNDTPETLAALDPSVRYGRLAAWLADATEPEIAAHWERYRQTGTRSRAIDELIFLNWTRLDPRAAVAATAGGPDGRLPWWAWACHDPKTALAEVLSSDSQYMTHVARGVGEFHPAWLRAHFGEIPEEGRSSALVWLSRWADSENPLETLNFLRDQGRGLDAETFKALVRKDPWAAYDWIQQNPALAGQRHHAGGDPMDLLASSMASEQPEALARLATQTPPGELRRRMETALFDNLLATDPEAALERAKATEAPFIAARFLAKIGLGAVRTDPEKAFQLAAEIFARTDGSLRFDTKVVYPRGSSTSHGPETEMDTLLRTLVAQDPARVLDLAAPRTPNASLQGFSTLAGQWATQDLTGYSGWVNRQTDPAVREPAAGIVAAQLTSMGQFSEAAEWSMSSGKSGGQLSYTLQQWQRAVPGEAAAWLESSKLPDDQKANFKRMLEQNDS